MSNIDTKVNKSAGLKNKLHDPSRPAFQPPSTDAPMADPSKRHAIRDETNAFTKKSKGNYAGELGKSWSDEFGEP